MQLSIMSCIVMFFSSWWIIFFIVLPIGIKPEDEHVIGHDRGAPKKTNMKKKLIIVTSTASAFLLLYIAYMLLG